MTKYKSKESEKVDYVEETQPILLSATLLHSLSDKKNQYADLPIVFVHEFSQSSHFALIQVQPSSFKRMISNIIDNAVDAFEKRDGKVLLKLYVTSSLVKVTVEDNGKGMVPKVVEKILQNIAVTEGKDGHGVGLTQVSETLARNQGKMFIDSKIGQGTKIILEFPRIQTPEWIAEKIKLGKEDIVIIVDDDSSIHLAWDKRFESILKQFPDIKVRHFENGNDAIRYIDNLTEEEKQKTYLLADYELLKQALNGLQVVEKTKIKRSILVTSDFVNPIIQNLAAKMGTKILSKPLTSEIPIHVDESTNFVSDLKEMTSFKTVDLVLVDDDKNFAKLLMMYIFKNNVVDYFADPEQFKNNLKNYSKDTRIYLDNNYTSTGIRGLDIAKALYEKGFTRLYLLTGDTFQPGEMPDYLKVIRKDDINNIKDW